VDPLLLEHAPRPGCSGYAPRAEGRSGHGEGGVEPNGLPGWLVKLTSLGSKLQQTGLHQGSPQGCTHDARLRCRPQCAVGRMTLFKAYAARQAPDGSGKSLALLELQLPALLPGRIGRWSLMSPGTGSLIGLQAGGLQVFTGPLPGTATQARL